ncbi:MAG TPA: hypothetical protein VI937_03185 [Negativicutes bacterium]|nr:hypothetical protein [Negativicutes bacterium]
MIDDKDVEKLIGAMKEVFATKEDYALLPTSKMVEEGFEHVLNTMATKEQVQKIDDRLKVVEEKLDNMADLRPRVKKLEEALEIE